LGTWQVQRAQWKAAILARMDEAAARDPMENPLTSESIAKAPDFETGVARGIFLHDLEVAVGPRTREGVAGYHILTPFRLADGAIMFVNRGWIPTNRRPASTRPDGLTKGPTFVAGTLRSPEKDSRFVPDNDPAHDAWYRLDLSTMAAARDLPRPLPKILYAQREESTAPFPMRGDLLTRPPDNHRAYAAFWFTMAGALTLVFALRFMVTVRFENREP
jgi:surfeit locus 1 family protein